MTSPFWMVVEAMNHRHTGVYTTTRPPLAVRRGG
jgi:hypothetical protein